MVVTAAWLVNHLRRGTSDLADLSRYTPTHSSLAAAYYSCARRWQGTGRGEFRAAGAAGEGTRPAGAAREEAAMPTPFPRRENLPRSYTAPRPAAGGGGAATGPTATGSGGGGGASLDELRLRVKSFRRNPMLKMQVGQRMDAELQLLHLQTQTGREKDAREATASAEVLWAEVSEIESRDPHAAVAGLRMHIASAMRRAASVLGEPELAGLWAARLNSFRPGASGGAPREMGRGDSGGVNPPATGGRVRALPPVRRMEAVWQGHHPNMALPWAQGKPGSFKEDQGPRY